MALLSKGEVAHLLGISLATVDRMAARGELTPVRIGPVLVRFRLADIEALIEARTEPTPAA